jgi:hypothetical protein
METDVIKALKEIIRKHTVRYEVGRISKSARASESWSDSISSCVGLTTTALPAFPPAAICAVRPTTICNASQSTFFRKTNGRRNTRFRPLTSHYMLHGEDRSK